MKFLLVVLVVGFVLWLMFGRKPARRPPPPARPQVSGPEGMVACRHCGVHLPFSEALPGPDGARYCSAAHRDAGPRA